VGYEPAENFVLFVLRMVFGARNLSLLLAFGGLWFGVGGQGAPLLFWLFFGPAGRLEGDWFLSFYVGVFLYWCILVFCAVPVSL
jgi:hypothetical protein